MTRQEYYSVFNAEQVYKDLAQARLSPERTAPYMELFGRHLHPHTVIGAGDSERLTSGFAAGARVAMAGVHISQIDPVEAGAMTTQREEFAGEVGNFIIPAKVELHEIFGVGDLISQLGAMPTWRTKDMAKIKAGGITPEEEEELDAAHKASILIQHDYVMESIVNGSNYFNFSQGERQKLHPIAFWRNKPHDVGELKPGFSHVVSGAAEHGVDTMTVAVGLTYGRGPKLSWLSPTMQLLVVEHEDRHDRERVTEEVRVGLSTAQILAEAVHKAR